MTDNTIEQSVVSFTLSSYCSITHNEEKSDVAHTWQCPKSNKYLNVILMFLENVIAVKMH